MKKNWKRILAATLAACMIFCDSSLVYATEPQPVVEEEPVVEEVEVVTETYSSGYPVLSFGEQITVEGGDSGVYYNQYYDFTPTETDNYYVYVDGTSNLFIANIQAYNFAGEIDYSIKPQMSYAFDVDASDAGDVVHGYLLAAGTTYRVNIQGRIAASATASFFIGTSAANPEQLMAGSTSGEYIGANTLAMFKISESETVTGILKLADGSANDMRIFTSVNTFQYSLNDEIAMVAIGGVEYYVTVKTNSDSGATLFWNNYKSETLELGEIKELAATDSYELQFYEFVPSEDKDYLISAYSNRTNVFSSGYNYCWTNVLHNDGGLRAYKSSYTGADYTQKYYGEDYTDATNVHWKRYQYPENCQKVYIIAYAMPNTTTEVTLKEFGTSVVPEVPNTDITLNDEFYGTITIPAGESATVTYEGKHLGDYFIATYGNVEFENISVGAGLQSDLTYNIFMEPVVAYGLTNDYEEGTTDTATFTFKLTNTGDYEQGISIFNSLSPNHISEQLPTNEYFYIWDIENASTGEQVGYFRFTPENTTVYESEDLEWVLLEGDESNSRADKYLTKKDGTIVLTAGNTYILKFVNESYEVDPFVEHEVEYEYWSSKLSYNNDRGETRVRNFWADATAEYSTMNDTDNVEVWHNDYLGDGWVYVEQNENYGYDLKEGEEYLVYFKRQDTFGQQRQITVLDYDYYQALIQSGGSVTVDGSDVTINPGKAGFSFWDVLLSFFGIAYYDEYSTEVFADGNGYWVSDEGAFEASEYYKIVDGENGQELVSCEYEEVTDGDVVVIKYEPEIIWVDSMEVSVDTTSMGIGETTQIQIDAKAATEKYLLENPIFSYKSSNPNVLSVDENGMITAKGKGTATITVAADVAARYAEKCPEKILQKKIKISVIDKEYDIHYELNGGQIAGTYPETFKNSNEIVLPEANRVGYNFLGWYTTEDFAEGTEISVIPAGTLQSQTVYAKWEFAAEFSLKINAQENAIVHPYNTASKCWEYSDATFTVESDPVGVLIDKNYYYGDVAEDGTSCYSLIVDLYRIDVENPDAEPWFINCYYNDFTISAEDIVEPGTYRLTGHYKHPGEAEQELKPVEFTVECEKREYPVNKEIEWSGIAGNESCDQFGEIYDQIVEKLQPYEDNLAIELGEEFITDGKIVIKNAKDKVVAEDAKLASGTYNVIYQIAHERFLEEAVSTLTIDYSELGNAGVKYLAADTAAEEDSQGRTAGSTIAFDVFVEETGEYIANSTPYTTGVVIIPMISTPWGEISADELANELETQGYEGYTVEVAAEETATKQILEILPIITDYNPSSVVSYGVNGSVAGKTSLTLTTTVKNELAEPVAEITSVVKTLNVVNGGVDAVSDISMELYKIEQYESGDEYETPVAVYEESEDGVKTYLIEKDDNAGKYNLAWSATNFAGYSDFDANLSWKSSNSKLAAVKTTKDSEGNVIVTVTVPKNAQGVVDITATAKDAGKKSKFVKLVIVDAGMRLDTTSLTMNSLKTEERAIAYLYPNVLSADANDTTVHSLYNEVKLYDKVKVGKVYEYVESEIFDSSYNIDSGELLVTFKEPQAKAKTHTVYVGVSHALTGEVEYHALKIKDTCALPKKPSLKVTKAYETVYTDGYAELTLTLNAPAATLEDGFTPAIQVAENQKFEVIGWEDISDGEGLVWKLKVKETDESVLPTGSQKSKTTKGVKFEIQYADYLTGHTATVNITATKTLPKLSVYGRNVYVPAYYTDADIRYVDVVIPLTDGLVEGFIPEDESYVSFGVDEDFTYAYLGSENVETELLRIALKDPGKFELVSAEYWDGYTEIPAKKGSMEVENAVILTVKVNDSQKKDVKLQLEIDHMNLTDTITTGILTIKARKVSAESITAVNEAYETVKSLTFNSNLAGKESTTLHFDNPAYFNNLSYANKVSTRILVEAADKNSRNVIGKNAIVLDVDEENKEITITSTKKAFDYKNCKLKVTMLVEGTDDVVKTKSTTITLNFKKALAPKVTLTNTKLYRGLEKFTDEHDGTEYYWSSISTVKAKLSNMPVGSCIKDVRFADLADYSKYCAPYGWEENGTFHISHLEEYAPSLGKDKVDLIYEICTATGDVICVNTSVTLTIADNISMKANQKSINLYNSAVGPKYGKDVTFYDEKGHVVEVVEIVNAEELTKAGINFDIDVTNGEEEGQDTGRFYVDKSLKRGTEKTYTVKAKVAMVNAYCYDEELGEYVTETATEKIVSFKIVLKK